MPEPILAWRVWGLIKPHFIASPGEVWMPRAPFEASCPVDPMGITNRRHIVSPHIDCTCGIYSCKDKQTLSDLLNYTRNTQVYFADVLGEVAIWGKIIRHETGYRSQYAYPKRIWLLKEEHQHLGPLMGYLYGIPTESGVPENFPERNMREVIQESENSQQDPVPPNLQYTVAKSEIHKLLQLADGRTVASKIAQVILEVLDEDFKVDATDLFAALVKAKEAGRITTKLHAWAAFETRRRQFGMFTRRP